MPPRRGSPPPRRARRPGRAGAAPGADRTWLLAAVAASVLLGGAPRLAHAQWTWTDVTTPALAETVSTTDKKGVAFVDFDRDGDLDICTVGEGTHPATLLVNDGFGNFTPLIPAAFAPRGSGSGQTWGDFDRDGDLDVFFSMEEEPQRLMRNDGNGVFTNVTPPVLQVPAHGHSTTWVDVDRDGWLDLYVAYLKQPSLFLHNYHGTLVDATTDSLGAFPGDGIAWGDYDNDMDQDVFLARFNNTPDLLLRNDGVNGFTDVTTPNMKALDNNHSAACADYDNDGDLDIFEAGAIYPNHLFRNNGTGVFADVTPLNLKMGWHCGSENWGDFDNDGWLDLFITCTGDSSNHLFRNNHDGTFTDVTTGPLRGTGYGAGVANGDYDGDGDLDLYVSSYLKHPNQLLRNDLANGNHWLEVDLVGTRSNLTALGARVELLAGGVLQTRFVSGNVGFRSQNASTVHFGLGAATTIDLFRVSWPSGISLDTTIVGVDRRLTIVEDDTQPVAVGTPVVVTGREPALSAPSPNPVTGATAFEEWLPSPGEARVTIVDTEGRSVRNLETGRQSQGRHRLSWDGRDAQGRRVAAGVYWCVLEAGATRASRRVAVLP